MGALWATDARADPGQLVLLPPPVVTSWEAAAADTGGPIDAVSREVGVLVDVGSAKSDAWTREVAILSEVPDAATTISSREVGVLQDASGISHNATSREVAALVVLPTPTASDALSRETALLADAAGSPIANAASREVSVSVDTTLRLAGVFASREVSTLVDPPLAASADATAREVAVLVEEVPALADAATREVAALVDTSVAAIADATAREVAVLVEEVPALTDATTREVAVLVDPPLAAIVDAASREVSVLRDYPTPTLLTMMTVRPVVEGIEVRWQFGPDLAVRETALERAGTADGAFRALAVTPVEDSDGQSAVDRTVEKGATYWYRLAVLTQDGGSLTFAPMSATALVQTTEVRLEPIAPNPARGAIRIGFALPRVTRVRIGLFDVTGREIATLADQPYPAGHHLGVWDLTRGAGACGAGVYFIRLQAEGRSLTRRLVIVR